MDMFKFLKETAVLVGSEELLQFKKAIDAYQNICILGNGGSHAVSLHITQDYCKVLGKNAFTFSNIAQLSCYANDYGWESAYFRFLYHTIQTPDTLVILISSSGESKNILASSRWCIQKNVPLIILTGFNRGNPLRSQCAGYENLLVDYHVDSRDYGVIELIHEALLHSVC